MAPAQRLNAWASQQQSPTRGKGGVGNWEGLSCPNQMSGVWPIKGREIINNTRGNGWGIGALSNNNNNTDWELQLGKGKATWATQTGNQLSGWLLTVCLAMGQPVCSLAMLINTNG